VRGAILLIFSVPLSACSGTSAGGAPDLAAPLTDGGSTADLAVSLDAGATDSSISGDLSGCLDTTPPVTLHEQYCGADAGICYLDHPIGGL
jgi:hypothetical protein